MKNKSQIQIWSDFDGPKAITKDGLEDNYQVRVDNNTVELPENIKQDIKRSIEGKPISDNPVPYLVGIRNEKGLVTLDTNVRGFSVTFAYNRDKEFHKRVEELNKYKLLTSSTHCHLITNDGKIVFGTKKNQFNQVSGFGGFPNINEDSVEANGVKLLDTHKCLENRLRPEIGEMAEGIVEAHALGVTYVDTAGLRGTDTDFLVKVDETAKNIQTLFRESSQFEKELHIVDFNPHAIANFMVNIHENGGAMSKYAIGCEFLVAKHFFGEKDANKYLTRINEDLGIKISTNNQTDYLN